MNYIIKKCGNCGKEINIYEKDYRLKRQSNFYCSKKCSDISKKNGKEMQCLGCGKAFYSTRNKLCSKKCTNDFLGKKEHKIKNKKLYKKWWHIINRCNNEKDISYSNYGARGIKVCDNWLDYDNFAKWSLENGYAEGLEIDRINCNGNYEPNNCRYVSRLINSRNKRNTLKYLYQGKEKTLKEIAEQNNISYKLLWQRINREKMSLESALSVKAKRRIKDEI